MKVKPSDNLFTAIGAFLFGRKYYANIINTRGTNKNELSSFIFKSKQEALDHARELRTNRSYRVVQTVSFRSRIDY